MQLVHNADWPQDRAAARPPFSPPAEPAYGLHEVARQLGVWKRSERWLVAYLGALIAEEDFPAPLPVLVKGVLSREIHPRKSRWLASALRVWFLTRTPAQAVASIEDAEDLERAAAASDRMDRRAETLFGGAS